MERPRLLVIDDDVYTRNALHALFTPRGWQVGLAGSVAEGLVGLDPAPHCIILDLNLPDGGGETILRQVRSRHPSTLVAVCSGSEDARQIEEVRSLRPEVLLWKPIDLAPIFRLCDLVFARSA
ncbi:response regulator [Tundrisphaera sp. TA3]|uniref:response regulator n=1 Tax=Tundrisphaera sp. TA3 TaxID=3435775 RepID=UPI003EBE24B8